MNNGLTVKSHSRQAMYPYACLNADGTVSRYMRESTYKQLRAMGLLHCGRLTTKALELLTKCHN